MISFVVVAALVLQTRACGGGSGCCPRAPPPVATCGSGCQQGYQCGTYGCTRRKALSALTTRIDGVIVGDESGEQAHTAPLNAKVVPVASNLTVDKLMNPNFIFHTCCEARGLPDACLRYCHFNTYTANSLERMFHKEDRCPIEAAHEIHYCAAQGIDHTEDIANCIFTRNKDPVIEQLVQALVEKYPKQGCCNCAIEKRSRSIVLSGLPEPSEELRASEKQAELEKRVTDILDVLEVDCKPSEVFRMGRVNGGRPRLVKLILPSRSYWATALRNAHRLRTSSYSSVFVRKSMTPDERKLDYDLRQEAKDRNKSANERVWVVYKGELKRIQDLPYRQQSCCASSGVADTTAGDKCLSFCDQRPNRFTALDVSYLPCYDIFENMKRCFFVAIRKKAEEKFGREWKTPQTEPRDSFTEF
ncbi:hypothetical protein Y032_0005g2544 [Ancylostoma ceylanicum]|uniref:Domain of unknown function DB domain-containing protein n=1 Tax=Ancylostoma ceylanicum TaxID=53326 RepID=A0A016VSG6_9BILA|nr:hypothetical protein Y032_0005g2544 [Ancylostoma ceylanicum]